jgi:hypothetical protein
MRRRHKRPITGHAAVVLQRHRRNTPRPPASGPHRCLRPRNDGTADQRAVGLQAKRRMLLDCTFREAVSNHRPSPCGVPDGMECISRSFRDDLERSGELSATTPTSGLSCQTAAVVIQTGWPQSSRQVPQLLRQQSDPSERDIVTASAGVAAGHLIDRGTDGRILSVGSGRLSSVGRAT